MRRAFPTFSSTVLVRASDKLPARWYNDAAMNLSAVCWKPRPIVCLAAAFLLLPLVLPVVATEPEVGSYAPPLQCVDLAGTARDITWGDGSPAVTIVYFFDPQNSICLLEINFLDALYSRGRDFGLAVYAVEARGRQPAEVTRSLERFCQVYRNPVFPILADPSFRASRTYGAEQVPVTFIMESHGVILNRVGGYSISDAVVIARRVEQLLRRERGFFSPALRESGISEAEEQEAEARLTAADAARASVPAMRALAVGDRAPDFEFTDIAGGAGQWRWSGELALQVRVLAFFSISSPSFSEELNWLDGLARRGRDAGLQVLAVEAGGLDDAALKLALDRYRRGNPDPSFLAATDPGGKFSRAFGPWEQLPQTYVLGGDGMVVYHAEGFSAREGEIISGKVERSYLLAGRPLPPARSDGAAATAPVEEEAPTIRDRQDLDDRYRSAIVQGDSAFMVWEFDRALAHYLTALEAQPQDLHALARTARIYERRGETGSALRYWQRVLVVQPDHAEAAGRIGELRRIR